MDFLKYFFLDTKAWVGIIIIAMGALFLFGALKKRAWMFGNRNKKAYKGVNNLFNIFSPNGGRYFIAIGGALLILLGMAWCVLYLYARL
jgi:hypothetical protein